MSKYTKKAITVLTVLSVSIIGIYSAGRLSESLEEKDEITSIPVTYNMQKTASEESEVPARIIPEAKAETAVGMYDRNIYSEPARIVIPNALVDARVIPVGLTKTGNLDVPPNYVETGWYRYGPKPGQEGSAVIDGHVDNGGAIPGVFKRLRNLRLGDDIYVTGNDGTKLHFVVTDVSIYNKNSFPSETIFTQGGQPLLKLITCHGKFLKSENTYSDRLVVTAALK